MKHHFLRGAGRAALVLTAFGGTGTAIAAPEQATIPAAVDEASGKDDFPIVVTARKREENLQDVPISISVVSSETLQKSGVVNLEQLAPSIPGLFATPGVAIPTLQIRGIGSGPNSGFEQSVGQVVDGIFYGRSQFARMSFLDVEQVEVLKGPQGALIGKNTTAGAINIRTASPSSQLDGYLTGSYEFAGSRGVNVQGALAGALADGLQARAAFMYDNHNGYIRNIVTGKKMPSNEDWAARGSLAWQPSDTLDVNLRWTHGDFSTRGRSQQLENCDADVLGLLAPFGLGASACRLDWETVAVTPRLGTGDLNRSRINLDTVSLTFDLDVGDATLSALSGYGRYNFLEDIEGDVTPAEAIAGTVTDRYKQYSQEIRLLSNPGGTFDYIIGGLYLRTEQLGLFALNLNLAPLAGLPGQLGFTDNISSDQTADSASLFAQGTYRVTDTLLVTASGRYTNERKRIRQIEFPSDLYGTTPQTVFPPFFPPLTSHDVRQKRKKEDFSPALDIQWKPNADTMVYGSVRRGFKSGGFDQQFSGTQAATEANLQYDDEKVLAYELGTKFDFGSTGQLSIAAFRSNFDNLQVSVPLTVPGGLPIFVVGNAAKAVTQGIELDGRWRPARGLVLTGAVTYLDAKYHRYDSASCYAGQTIAQGCVANVQDMRGKPLQFASKWSGSLGVDFNVPLDDDWSLNTFVQGTYVSRYALMTNLDPNLFQGGYVKLNANVTLNQESWGMKFSLIGRNLTNQLTSSYGQTMPSLLPTNRYRFVDAKRSFAFQVSKAF